MRLIWGKNWHLDSLWQSSRGQEQDKLNIIWQMSKFHKVMKSTFILTGGSMSNIKNCSLIRQKQVRDKLSIMQRSYTNKNKGLYWLWDNNGPTLRSHRSTCDQRRGFSCSGDSSWSGRTAPDAPSPPRLALPSIPATQKEGKGKQETMPHYDIVNQKRRIILTSQSMMWKRCQQTIYTEMRPNSLRTLKLSDFQSSFIKYSLCKCESRDWKKSNYYNTHYIILDNNIDNF